MKNHRPYLFAPAVLAALVCFPLIAHAGDRGEGGCAVVESAPVYDLSGKNVLRTLDKGECVVGITTHAAGLFGWDYLFTEEKGRVDVQFFPDKTNIGTPKAGSMNMKDLKRFTFECGCGTTPREKETCTPFISGGFFKMTWNACFKEGSEKALDAIESGSSAPPSRAAASTHSAGSEKALTNEDVLALVKVGLEDKLIVSKIQSAKAVNFDLSTDGLIALKTAKVSNAIVDAMMKKK